MTGRLNILLASRLAFVAVLLVIGWWRDVHWAVYVGAVVLAAA